MDKDTKEMLDKAIELLSHAELLLKQLRVAHEQQVNHAEQAAKDRISLQIAQDTARDRLETKEKYAAKVLNEPRFKLLELVFGPLGKGTVCGRKYADKDAVLEYQVRWECQCVTWEKPEHLIKYKPVAEKPVGNVSSYSDVKHWEQK